MQDWARQLVHRRGQTSHMFQEFPKAKLLSLSVTGSRNDDREFQGGSSAADWSSTKLKTGKHKGESYHGAWQDTDYTKYLRCRPSNIKHASLKDYMSYLKDCDHSYTSGMNFLHGVSTPAPGSRSTANFNTMS